MKFYRRLSGFVILSLAFSFFSPALHADDEGMFPFDNIPRAEIKSRYGFNVSDAWLKKIQMAAVRFGTGGSGSFVSPEGLLLTNYHVALDVLQKLSTKDRNYVRDGFQAATRADALKAEGIELNVLVSIEDVTAQVEDALKDKTGDVNAVRQAVLNQLKEERSKATGLRADTVAFYGGAQYEIYLYKRYTDVRLEFAPEYAVALFGGDTDNFKYPRHGLDMAFFRVYENNAPIKSENFLSFSTAGAKENDLLFVAGYPLQSSRLSIAPHLKHLRDGTYPLFIDRLKRIQSVLQKYSALGPEQARSATNDLFAVENGLKAFTGQLKALQRDSLIEHRLKEEESLRRALASDPARAKEYAEAYEAIATAYKNLASYEGVYYSLDGGAGFDTSLFNPARIIARLAIENTKPNEARFPAFTDSRRPGLLQSLYSPPGEIDKALEKAKLANSLSLVRDQLGSDNPLAKKILNGKTPEARAAELIDGTRVGDVEFRKELIAGGLAAVEKSTDPMIALAYAIEPETRAIRKRYETEVLAVQNAAYAKLARLSRVGRGSLAYPDANYTLRLTYGVMRGYADVPPFTDFGGLFASAQQHQNQEPYQLPANWLGKQTSLNLHTPLNFITTHDATIGSSGSPVLNRNAEVVGLLFDLNEQSLSNKFSYDETQARSICLDARAIIESLDKVYASKDIVAELLKK